MYQGPLKRRESRPEKREIGEAERETSFSPVCPSFTDQLHIMPATRQVIGHPSKAPITAIGSSVIVSGSLVFMAGAVGVDEAGNWVEGTVQDRTKAVFARVSDRLSLLGLGLEDRESLNLSQQSAALCRALR